MRKYRHLSWADRIRIEALYKAKLSQTEIARQLNVNRSTVCRELKKGSFSALTSDLKMEERHSPDIANQKFMENLKSKGPALKIGADRELAEYIETQIAECEYSPEAVLLNIKMKKLSFKTEIKSVQTLYSYISKGIFLRLTNKSLPVKRNRKYKKRKIRRIQSCDAARTSIEKRPEKIKTREEFAIWKWTL